ncbi:shikimate kinase [Catenulispora sp. GAS73]
MVPFVEGSSRAGLSGHGPDLVSLTDRDAGYSTSASTRSAGAKAEIFSKAGHCYTFAGN